MKALLWQRRRSLALFALAWFAAFVALRTAHRRARAPPPAWRDWPLAQQPHARLIVLLANRNAPSALRVRDWPLAEPLPAALAARRAVVTVRIRKGCCFFLLKMTTQTPEKK